MTCWCGCVPARRKIDGFDFTGGEDVQFTVKWVTGPFRERLAKQVFVLRESLRLARDIARDTDTSAGDTGARRYLLQLPNRQCYDFLSSNSPEARARNEFWTRDHCTGALAAIRPWD